MTEQEYSDGSYWDQAIREMDEIIARRRADLPDETQTEPTFSRSQLEWFDRRIRLRRAGYSVEQVDQIQEIVEAPVELIQDKPQESTL